MSESYKYWAFISYSSRDRTWGEWLHRGLETFKVPRALVGRKTLRGEPVPKSTDPIFRDRDELPTSADLGRMIHDALEQSRYLIVVCSPNAAQSRWVNKEIIEFKQLGRENRILAIIVDGQPNASDAENAAEAKTECFPSALRFHVDAEGNLTDQRVEPIAADVRPTGDGKAKALLKVIAGIIGVDFDLLFQRARRRRRLRVIQLAVLGLLLLTGGAWLWRYKEQQRMQLADEEARKARLLASQNYAEQADRSDARVALAWLAAALRLDPANTWAAQRTASLLRQVNWPIALARLPSAMDAVTGIKVAPGRSFFAAVDDKLGLRFVALPSGQPLSERLILPGRVRSLAFSADSTRLGIVCEEESGLSGLASGRLWFAILDAPSGKFIKMPERTECTEVVGGGAGTTLLAVSSHRLQRWDAATGRLLGAPLARAEIIRTAAEDPSAMRIATANADGIARIFDANSGALLGALMRHNAQVNAIAFSADAKSIATGSADGSARIWDASSGEPQTAALPQQSPVESLAVNADGSRLATVTADNTFRLWDTKSGSTLAGPIAPGGDWVSLTFSLDGSVLLVKARGASVQVLDALTGESRCLPIDVGQGVRDADWAVDGHKVLTVSQNHAAHLWDISARGVQPIRFTHSAPVQSFDLSTDGMRLVTGSEDGTARVWNLATGKELLTIAGTRRAVDGVRFIDGGDQIRTDTSDGAEIWDAQTGADIGEGTIYAVSHIILTEVWSRYSTDRRYEISAGADNSIRVLAAGQTEPVAPPIVLHSPPLDAMISPDGTRILIGCADGTAQVWDIRTASAQGRVMSHGGRVLSVQFSPDGRLAATGCENGTARIWEAGTGHAWSEPLRHNGPVAQVRFSADGRSIVTRAGNAAYAWDIEEMPVPVPAWVPMLAEAVAGRKINPDGTIGLLTADPADALAAVRRELTGPLDATPWPRLGARFLGD